MDNKKMMDFTLRLEKCFKNKKEWYNILNEVKEYMEGVETNGKGNSE